MFYRSRDVPQQQQYRTVVIKFITKYFRSLDGGNIQSIYGIPLNLSLSIPSNDLSRNTSLTPECRLLSHISLVISCNFYIFSFKNMLLNIYICIVRSALGLHPANEARPAPLELGFLKPWLSSRTQKVIKNIYLFINRT